jgi:septal ring factor EnvC (AmiA/AmiB activator)
MGLFTRKISKPIPLLIIKKGVDDVSIKECTTIEKAIADLERGINVSREEIERLRSSLKNLKNKTSIKLKNGEIIQS